MSCARFVFLAVVLVVVPSGALAQRRPSTPVSSEAWALTALGAVALATGVTLYLRHDGANFGGWQGGILLDEPARDGLRLHSLDARDTARHVSDALLVALLSYGAVDALAMSLLNDGPALAWQATAAYALVLGVTLIVDELVKGGADRERPFVRDCDEDPAPARCGTSYANHSFYSGHAATGFAAAGFSCAMHLGRSLLGDATADGLACGGSLLAASVTGLLRIMSDQHYLSDVVVGALIGFVVGFAVPLAVVPERPRAIVDEDASEDGTTVMVLPTFAPASSGVGALGLAASGTF